MNQEYFEYFKSYKCDIKIKIMMFSIDSKQYLRFELVEQAY